jgi:hypothetical protein
VSATDGEGAAGDEQAFVRMLERRLGSRRNPALRLTAISLEPQLAVRLDAELERLVRHWAEPADRGWWLAYGIGELRSVFIEIAVARALDDVERRGGGAVPTQSG